MTRGFTRIAASALVLLLVMPTAMATWRALGSWEPDTELDRTGPWMFQDANEEFGVNKVYFNVVGATYPLAANPNSALEGSRVNPPNRLFQAFYGVWVDCNQDGYIGMVDTAVLEYRVELAPNHVCGADEKTNMHNQQGWVSELRWIGNPGNNNDGSDPDDLPDSRDVRVILDWNADIWGDAGLPGDAITVTPTCSLFYHRTGQVANYLDCRATLETGQGTDAAGAALGFAADGEGQVDYDQPHALNVGTFGEEEDAPMVSAWDCSAGPQGVQTGMGANQHLTQETPLAGGYSLYAIQYTDEDGELNVSAYRSYNINGSEERNNFATRDVTYHAPAVGTDTTGSAAAAYNHTYEGAAGDCDTTNDDTGSLYENESPPVDVRIPSKRSVGYEFSFYEEQRSGAGKRGEPFDRGVYVGVRDGLGVVFSGSSWQGSTFAPTTTPPLAKTDLSADGARYYTFYANVTASTVSSYGLVLPAGGATGTYGAEWCFGATTGVVRGFNCDPDQWYINPDGSRIDGREFAVFAGHEYNLRDVDCYDWRVGTTPVYASGATIDSAAACAE
jgi:hypothetical protein